jgi:hypothetical protein
MDLRTCERRLDVSMRIRECVHEWHSVGYVYAHAYVIVCVRVRVRVRVCGLSKVGRHDENAIVMSKLALSSDESRSPSPAE